MALPETHTTGLPYKAVSRLRECCRQVEAEDVSNIRNKIHQTLERPYIPTLYITQRDDIYPQI